LPNSDEVVMKRTSETQNTFYVQPVKDEYCSIHVE